MSIEPHHPGRRTHEVSHRGRREQRVADLLQPTLQPSLFWDLHLWPIQGEQAYQMPRSWLFTQADQIVHPGEFGGFDDNQVQVDLSIDINAARSRGAEKGG